MKLAALLSGGKDSVYALYIMMQQEHEIKYLISMIPETEESYMFHHPNVFMAKLQAEAMNIPIMTKETKGEKEKELDDLKEVLSSIKDKVDGVVAGAIASEYQKQRIDIVCEELGLKSFAPLWHKNPEILWDDMIKAGFEVIITATAAEGMDEKWLGRKISKKTLDELKELNKKSKIHLAGEGGEFETLVLDAPFFKKRLAIEESEKIWDSSTKSGRFIVKKSNLEEK